MAIKEYSAVMTIGALGLVSIMANYFLASNVTGKTTGVIVNTFSDNITTENFKFLYLGLFLAILLAGYYINLVGDELFLKETKERHYVEGTFKMGLLLALMYFIFDGSKLFRSQKIYFYALTLVLSFLHPLFEKLTKTKDAYNTVKMTGKTMHFKNPKFWIVMGVMFLTFLFALSNRSYEISSGLFGSTKYLMMFGIIFTYLAYGIIKGRRITYWFYTYLINVLINPNNSFFNMLFNSITTSYILHSARKTDFEIYTRDKAEKVKVEEKK